jgi:hypothetical protein
MVGDNSTVVASAQAKDLDRALKWMGVIMQEPKASNSAAEKQPGQQDQQQKVSF